MHHVQLRRAQAAAADLMCARCTLRMMVLQAQIVCIYRSIEPADMTVTCFRE